ncbi:MAG: NAD-dependent epimerase/dehydratase family protein [Thermoanaerobaculia bacterium]|nr:MAG: NAD-dependent epimerase/dehydratase family protein [Thermoanaerobaculia bacterium]
MAGADGVLHLAATYEFWVPDRSLYRKVNVEGVRNVMECALERRVAKVVLVSTFGVWGQPVAEPIDERTPFGTERPSEYFQTKFEGEQLAWELARGRGLPLVVVYPGAVLGAGDSKASGAYLDLLAHHRMPATLFEETPFPFVHVDDVAEVVVRALEKPGNVGERYLAVAEVRTWGEMNTLVSELSGTPLPRLHMPGAMAMASAAFLTGLSKLTHRPPPMGMSVDQMKVMKAGGRATGEKARRELGVEYRPVREAVREFLAAGSPGVATPPAAGATGPIGS